MIRSSPHENTVMPHPVELAALICLIIGLGGLLITVLVVYRASRPLPGDSDNG